ncbi:hypothetical protein ACOMHN_045641 [Nucella lapillus]
MGNASPTLHYFFCPSVKSSLKKVEGGRQGRRFSLINLRSSTKSKNVSLSPTVTVLSPSTSTSSSSSAACSLENIPFPSSSTASLTVTQCQPSFEARLSEPIPAQINVPISASSTLQLESASATLQLVAVNSSLQRVPTTSASQIHLVPSPSTLHLLSEAGPSSALQLVPTTSSTTLQLVPSPSVVQRVPSFTSIQRVPSFSSIQRVPSISSPQHSPTSQSLYSKTSSEKSSRAKARDKAASKEKRKKESRKRSKHSGGQCSHNCPHGKRDSVDSASSGCLLEENHLSRKEILTKYRLHIFVAIIFFITLLFVSLGWYYRDLTREKELSEQKIFIDPRKRILTLSDHLDKIQVLLGQDLPQWQLPLHCLVLPGGNPNKKQCEWKSNALLSVVYFVARDPETKASAQCYNVSWQMLRHPRVPYDCFDVGGSVWYGPSNRSDESLPIRGSFSYVPTPYHLSHSGTFSSAVDLYWLSSSGVGLILDPNYPLTLHWNSSVPNHLCVISNYSGPLYGDTSALPAMNYTICNGPDPLRTHVIMMKNFLRRSNTQERPSADMFGFPQWSVSRLSGKADYTQENVLDIVARIKNNGLDCSLLMMDGDWQKSHGDLTFDPSRFTNVTNMTDIIVTTCSLGLQVSPYFDYRSVTNFHEGVAKELFVKDAGGQVPGLTRWQNGPAVAMLDVSRSTSRTWFNSLLTRLLTETGAKALRLSYGNDGWLPYKATFSQKDLSLHQLRSRMAALFSSFTDRLVLEHTSGSQGLRGFVAVPTKLDLQNGRQCLAHAIEKAVTLGLLGYPYVLADGFVPQKSPDLNEKPSQDLFTRWMQMAAFFPAFQFSVAPWDYDELTVRLAANLTRLHKKVVAETIRSAKLQKEIAEGLPILRPVWWLDPRNRSVHAMRINNEFIVGDSVLVAPVLCEGEKQRDIYVPPGVWSDKLRNTIVVGPKMLEGYRAELTEVPYFIRMKTYEDTKQ